MKNKLIFVKIGLVCGVGVVSILATAGRLQAQNNLQAVKEVSSNKIPVTYQHLTQVNSQEEVIKALQAEARHNVVVMNRSQEAYFLENKRFTSKLQDLGIAIKPETESYFYRIKMLSPTLLQNLAIPKREGLKSYTGILYTVKVQQEDLSLAILCESLEPSKTAPPPPQMKENEPQCPTGFNKITR